jgi:hypothetical protein
MALPKLTTPEFETLIPSTKDPIKFRPFLVKEEKNLYIALESGEEKDMKNAILNVLESCILTPDVNVKKLTSYDVEYIFLKLRSKSVGEVIELKVGHKNSECKAITDVSINVDDIEVHFDQEHKDVIQFDNGIGIKLKSPDLNKLLVGVNNKKSEIENVFETIASCVVNVFDQENVYEDFTEQELMEFLENLSQNHFREIQNFFDTMPKLYHDIEFTCKVCGETESIRLQGLQSFFT